MTTQLAIGYLAAAARNPRGAGAPPRSAQVSDHDPISSRPEIPHAVISWLDDDLQDVSLPIGAGDPAVDVEGPPSFLPPDRTRAKRVTRFSVDAVMFGVLAVMLLGLAGAVAKVGEEPNTAWAARNPAALAAVGATREAVVDVSVARVESPAAPSASEGLVPRLMRLAGAAKAAVN